MSGVGGHCSTQDNPAFSLWETPERLSTSSFGEMAVFHSHVAETGNEHALWFFREGSPSACLSAYKALILFIASLICSLDAT